jgi:hypothetical protein
MNNDDTWPQPTPPGILLEEGDWQLRADPDQDATHERWLYHLCKEPDGYSWGKDVYRFIMDVPSTRNYKIDHPCTYCGSVAPEGLRAMYMMLEAGHD